MPWFCVFLIFLATTISSSSFAQQSICAKVKIEIDQELTLERQGFEARMGVNNGQPVQLTDFTVLVNFLDKNKQGVTATSDPNNTTAKFFIRLSDGNSIPTTIDPSATANIKWLIIPALSAGGQTTQGELYYVGATVSYKVGGITEKIDVSPDYIYVKPMPKLTLDYFLPLEVDADDPFTPAIEPPVPFSLGVRVQNAGFGTAHGLQISSAQPKIIDNQQGLLVAFQILGSEVNGLPATTSLLVNFGDIAPNHSDIGRWIMTSSLSGRFTEFNATFSHDDELGGKVTSLINSVNTHSLVHDVLVDLPGRDAVQDFLSKDGSNLHVYESDNVDSIAQDLSSSAQLSGSGDLYQLSGPGYTGFGYIKLTDPKSGNKVIKSATRSDGKLISSANAWLSKSWDRVALHWNYFLNVFDVNNTGAYAYTINFGDAPLVNHPPVLQYIPDKFVNPGNQLGFIVQASDPDGSPVSLSSGFLPSGATFNDSGNGVGTFSWTPGANQIGIYNMTFTASDGLLRASRTMNITVTTASNFIDSWKSQKWPGITDPNIIGNSADPDGDGLSNLVEYALNTDPTLPNGGGPQVGTEVVNGKTYLTLTYVKRTDDPNLQFNVIASDSLSTPDAQWQVQSNFLNADQTGVPSGMEKVKVRDSIAIEDGGPRRFIKLSVTTNQ